MTTDEAIRFAELGESIGGRMTDDAFVVLVAAVRGLRELNAELVTALQHLCDVGCEFYDMDMGENGSPAVDAARAAIAKAKEVANA